MTEQARILIVEDDSLIAMELQDRLQDMGYRVCAHTRTAEDAVMLAEGLQPDLVLMDIRLRGGMDGVEGAGLIRSRFDIPIVYVTAYADDATVARAKVTEPYGYIIKPFGERELLSSIEMALYKHRVEKEIRDRERRLSATLSSTTDAILTTDAEGQIVLANPVAEELLGPLVRENDQVPTSRVLTLYPRPGSRSEAPMCPIREVLGDGQARDLEGYLLQTTAGKRVAIEGSATPVPGVHGEVVGVVITLRDISRRLEEEQKNEALRERLYEAQQIEAVASLTQRLAHNFNEHLTSILAAASLILADDRWGEADPVPVAAERIRQAARRSADLTRQMLSLTGDHVRDVRVVDLHALLDTAVERLDTLVGAHVTVDHHLWPEPLYVRADPTELEQVLTHLALNAREAMPDGGAVEITTAACEAGGIPYACLRFCDTGIGMDAHTRDRAFEPFFSTKPSAAGLGLPISKSIVEQLGGWIEVDTEPGRGTDLTVYLRLCAPGEGDVPKPPSLDELRGHGQQILLVEDDAQVRVAVSAMLRASGYSVVEARNALTALDLFEAAPAGFDLLLTDVTLPERDGLSVAHDCRTLCPHLPILITGSLTSGDAQWLHIRSEGYPFLPKPFGLMDLLPAIKAALERNDVQTTRKR